MYTRLVESIAASPAWVASSFFQTLERSEARPPGGQAPLADRLPATALRTASVRPAMHHLPAQIHSTAPPSLPAATKKAAARHGQMSSMMSGRTCLRRRPAPALHRKAKEMPSLMPSHPPMTRGGHGMHGKRASARHRMATAPHRSGTPHCPCGVKP